MDAVVSECEYIIGKEKINDQRERLTYLGTPPGKTLCGHT
jgi:hypothetical protein